MAAAAAVDLQLPPGFRFHPTDEELVMHYLCRKCAAQAIDVPIITEIDLYKYDPWDLPDFAPYGEKEWYFFSPRDRKYPNGSRPNRSAGSGYWKATGADKPIGHPKPVGIKKALVFYAGKAPRGEKTNWIMHEYRLADVDRSARKRNHSSLRLDDWVLCRIYNKRGAIERQQRARVSSSRMMSDEDIKPVVMAEATPMMYDDDLVYLDASDSIHRPDSSCSEHVLSPEVESMPKMTDWDRAAVGFPFGYLDGVTGLMGSQYHRGYNPVEQVQDVRAYITKPF